MTALPFDLIPFDPGNESHAAFVYDTFRKSMDHWPWSEMPKARLMDRLKHELATPGTFTKLATPNGMPDSFLGWYSARAPTLVYGFTRYSARRQGVATRALFELGMSFGGIDGGQWWSVFWTPAQSKIVQHKRWRLSLDLRDAFDERH